MNLLQIEIPMILQSIERLIDDVPKVGYIPFRLLDEIDRARLGFERNREWVVFFRSEKFQRELLEFYRDLTAACQDSRAVEQLAWGQYPPLAEYVSTQRSSLTSKFQALVTAGRLAADHLGRQ